MTWWDWFSVLVGAGGLVASIFGAWITYAARWNGERTRELMRETRSSTEALLREMQDRSQASLERMEERTQASLERIHQETLTVLDRIDARAEERHRFER